MTPSKGAGHSVACKRCHAHVTSSEYLVSRAYRGYRGKAALYRTVSTNTTSIGPETVQLMQTGAYTVCPLTCSTCNAYLGWEFARAHEESEAWKVGHALLESTCIHEEHEKRESIEDERRGREPHVRATNEPSAALPVQAHLQHHRSHPHTVWRRTIVKLNSTASLLAGTNIQASRLEAKWEIDT